MIFNFGLMLASAFCLIVLINVWEFGLRSLEDELDEHFKLIIDLSLSSSSSLSKYFSFGSFCPIDGSLFDSDLSSNNLVIILRLFSNLDFEESLPPSLESLINEASKFHFIGSFELDLTLINAGELRCLVSKLSKSFALLERLIGVDA